ncbi:hypothetical protein EGR_08091 [Echinococcus granulosus]|uniref:Uncharacterized protein n=1 Tax=Echinococcus granulosus TaxID=6210 RepID=W6U758_ECHGR|nr:hypothetical protein EGR_08091 [Echinococcus granulosus]EUB57015.1 hypothetical protein EGR_08091 [Echinococcus granulosus]
MGPQKTIEAYIHNFTRLIVSLPMIVREWKLSGCGRRNFCFGQADLLHNKDNHCETVVGLRAQMPRVSPFEVKQCPPGIFAMEEVKEERR